MADLNTLKIPQKDAAHTKDLRGLMPAWVERTSDNYNHLFEQPVAFYALTICIAIINNFDAFNDSIGMGICNFKNCPFTMAINI